MDIELIRRALNSGWNYARVEASAETELLILNALKEVGDTNPNLDEHIAFVEKRAALEAEWEAKCDAEWDERRAKNGNA